MSNAIGAPVLYHTEDAVFEFPLHTAAEFSALLNQCRAAIQKHNRAIADELMIAGLARAAFLSEHDPFAISVISVDQYLGDPCNARDVLTKSLAKSGKATEEIAEVLAKVHPADMPWIARLVSGVRIDRRDKKEDGDGK